MIKLLVATVMFIPLVSFWAVWLRRRFHDGLSDTLTIWFFLCLAIYGAASAIAAFVYGLLFLIN